MILNNCQIATFINNAKEVNFNPFGYDVTLAKEFKVPSSTQRVIDSASPDILYNNIFVDSLVVPSGSYVLGRSEEFIKVPNNCLGLCFSRSSMVRLGLNVNITPLESGWQGQITIEIFNASHYPIRIHPGQRIAQIVFFKGDNPTISYSSKGGRYQDQVGVVPSRGV